MEKLYEYLPRELVTFVLVTLFSLLIGLSQRKISLKREGETTLFGTDRTFTFIGILGYLLYILDPVEYRLFMGGGAILGLLLGLNYYVKQSQFHVFGVTTIIIALITYCIAPIVDTQPSWFYVMVVVTVLLFTELKHTFTELAQRMKNDEMITLAKFLAISGIILPMLPNENLIPDINLTPYTVWLATVVVSGISYLSYLLRRYVFHESGILVSGIIGGLYSSTATISVLARKSRKAPAQEAPEYAAAMLLAVSMMFLRFLILIGIFSKEILAAIYPYLLIMSLVTAGVAWYLHRKRKQVPSTDEEAEEEDGQQRSLLALRAGELKSQEALDNFYDFVIDKFDYVGNYLILLMYDTYDVPTKGKDNVTMDDSSEVFQYIVCCLCPVNLSKAGLSYHEENNSIEPRTRDWVVEPPCMGFMFPAFNDRSTDLHSMLYYTKKSEDLQPGMIDQLFGTKMPMSADTQKETFKMLIEDTLGEDGDYETVRNIHETLNQLIEEHKEEPEPLALDLTDMKKVFEQSGVEAEKMESFDRNFTENAGEKTSLLASNIAETRKFQIETPDIVIKVNPERADLVETRIIDGRRCLVIPVDDHIEVNGINVQTIKMKEREENQETYN